MHPKEYHSLTNKVEYGLYIHATDVTTTTGTTIRILQDKSDLLSKTLAKVDDT